MSVIEKQAPFPYDEAGFLDDFLVTWIFPLAKYLRSNQASIDNFRHLPKRFHLEEQTESVKKAWEEIKHTSSPNIFKAIWKVMKREIVLALIPGFCCTNFLFISAIMMLHIIDFMNGKDNVSNVTGYVIGYASLALLYTLLLNFSFRRIYQVIAKVKAILSQMVFEKALRIQYGEMNQGNQSGKITSLISSDLECFEGLYILSYTSGAPTFFIGSGVLLGFNLGVAGILGLILALVHLPLIYYFGKLAGKYRFASAAIGDSRMKLITNLIEGIRIVKLYGWEHPFLNSLFEKRKEEMQILRKKVAACSINKGINTGMQGLVIFLTFAVYVGLGNEINSATAFSSILVLMLSTQLILFIGTVGMPAVFMFYASMKRITQALLIKEAENKSCERNERKYTIKAENCQFHWTQPTNGENSQLDLLAENEGFCLENINFKLKPGELLIVIGSVGCGKSALLMGLLREIYLTSGKCRVSGEMSFASDEPWIVSGTIEENILMGSPVDDLWYKKVVKACCLNEDFDLFKGNNGYRDETIIGDRGVTLSGGQKARVSLARAVYANRDIILLDDPLSAVDPEVCSKLFNKCIKGLLKEKTVILVTHQTHFITQADKILLLNEGRQVFFGAYEEFAEQKLGSYLGQINRTKTMKEEEEKNEIVENETEQKHRFKRLQSMKPEESAIGQVPFSIYRKLFMLGFINAIFIVLCFIVQVAAQTCYLSIIFWVSYWSEASNQHEYSYFLGIAIIVILFYILSVLRYVLLMFPLLSASSKVHNLALQGVTFTKSLFFDLNPTGRMLNRFSKDASQMDEVLLNLIGESTNTMMLVLGAIIPIAIINPYVLIMFVPCILYSIAVIRFFAKPNKDLKRLELLTKSPILSTLTSAIHGLSTIRCLNLQNKLIKEQQNNIKTNAKVYFALISISRANQLYLEIGPNILNIANFILLVCLRDSMKPGLAGMSMSLSITLMGFVGSFVKNCIETDNSMTCPQRLLEYSKLRSEGELQTNSGFKIHSGKIEVKNLILKYRKHYDYVLKKLSFTIQPGMKTGIIGRTGAGKSSIMQVLFRLTNPQKGTIYIDEQDYMMAGLHDLRKQMPVIPQSATLILASLRDNLDPFHDHSDEEITNVLKKSKISIIA
jgi:ATP-binding cassette, subfamily C (CFTR/MRP), member 4